MNLEIFYFGPQIVHQLHLVYILNEISWIETLLGLYLIDSLFWVRGFVQYCDHMDFAMAFKYTRILEALWFSCSVSRVFTLGNLEVMWIRLWVILVTERFVIGHFGCYENFNVDELLAMYYNFCSWPLWATVLFDTMSLFHALLYYCMLTAFPIANAT